jgi:hypothetical protein
MKKVFAAPFLAILIISAIPTSSHALSCVDPEGMVDYIVKDPDSVVFTAKVLEQKEHVKDKAVKDDPNGMYDSGYTGQFVKVKKVHMGTVPNKEWVYFTRNGTWNYLCAGEPPKIGSEAIYVINPSSNSFEPQTVSVTYAVDSKIGKDLLKAIADAKLGVEPQMYEVSKADWITRIHDELKDMAFFIRIKLSEWTFWKSQK